MTELQEQESNLIVVSATEEYASRQYGKEIRNRDNRCWMKYGIARNVDVDIRVENTAHIAEHFVMH